MPTLPQRKDGPDVLPGADADSDCQVPPAEPMTVIPPDDEEEHEHDVTWGDVGGPENGGETAVFPDSWRQPQARWASWLENIALTVEKPVNRLVGNLQFNPFYHTGTIAFFLLLIVGLTGFYLFLFFQYGFDLSYDAVARLEGQFIGRTIRAIHRYASGALVITTLLHAYRTLFMERFRGPRWLAWVTGIIMVGFLWVAGVTGYWMLWDTRAQTISRSFVGFLEAYTGVAADVVVRVVQAALAENSWWVIGIFMAVHVLLFMITAVFFYLHIMRLNRPKWLPDLQWTVGMGLVLLLGALLFPLGTLPQASSLQLPGAITIDPLFLFYLPTAGTTAGVILWALILGVTAVGLAFPWLVRGRKKQRTESLKVNIIKDRCTGCTKCALDCPYGAIQMVERHDDKPHKYIAIEDPSLCVSCGICVGSCDGVAVGLGHTAPDFLWDVVETQLALAKAKAPDGNVKVVFTCERHAAHGAKPFLAADRPVTEGQWVEVIPLPCVGAAPPDLLTRTLDAGAKAVQVVGCPPDDCVNREGNLWAEQRLTRQRVPRLHRNYANAPVLAAWAAPNEFAGAIALKPVTSVNEETGEEAPDYLGSRRMFREFSWRNVAPAFVLLAFVLLLQILLTDLPFTPYPGQPVMVQVVTPNPAAPLGEPSAMNTFAANYELRLEVDDDVLLALPYLEVGADPFFIEEAIPPGAHHVRLSYVNEETLTQFLLFEETAVYQPGQIIPIYFDQSPAPGYSPGCS